MVTRRHFLTSTLLAGAGMATGCRPNPPLSRERSPGAPPPAFGLEEFSLSELQAAMESDEHTSRSITELYLGRIDQCNVNGPSLRPCADKGQYRYSGWNDDDGRIPGA
jgi:amidase